MQNKLEPVGEHLTELYFPEDHRITNTIEKFRRFFNAMEENIQNEIMITGIVNLLFENFPVDKKVQKFISDYLFEHEKGKISYKRTFAMLNQEALKKLSVNNTFKIVISER